jgi:mRNA interferase HigB
MRVVTRKRILQFIQRHPDSKSSLESWYAVVRRVHWKSFAEVKQVYANADLVERRTVFNIAGNKYRLIARLNYRSQVAFVLCVLTHAEYDKGEWK